MTVLLGLSLFALGCLFGFLLSFFFGKRLRDKSLSVIGDLVSENKEHQKLLFDAYLGELKASFKEQSLDSLQRSTETTYKLTSEQLEHNKKAIRDELSSNRGAIEKNISLMLEKVTGLGELIHTLEEKTGRNYGELGALLKQTNEQTKSLISTTGAIRDVLSNSQTRGFWGEKIAEDILYYAGFIENIHYKKQMTLPSGGRPDFTFLLPQELCLHMDVKFPLENYKNYVNAVEGGGEAKKYEKLFVADVKNTVKSLVNRSYIDPDKTVGCVLLFIPHEQIMSFIQEKAPNLVEETLKKHVIFCSPMSLLSVLMVVKKAVDTFKIQKTSQELMESMNAFKKQWTMYSGSFESLGKKIKDVEAEYDKLTGTRTRLLTSVVERMTKHSPEKQSD